MSADRLYEAITLLDDELIDEAGTYTPQKKNAVPWKRWAALAACLALAVGVGGAVLNRSDDMGNSSSGGSGADGSSTFLSYAGPVFPLTAVNDTAGITAQRDVTLDFLPWASAAYSTDILVTDSYTLTNPTGADKTLSVLYPFSSSLWALDERLPTLSAGGAELETGLRIGPYTGGFVGGLGPDGPSEELLNLDQLNSWEEYQTLLESGAYAEKALADFPDLGGINVIVYEFTDAWGDPGVKDAPNPTIRVDFTLDYDATTVLSYGFDGVSQHSAKNWMSRQFSIAQPQWPNYSDPHYLIVLGEDVTGMEIKGYVTGGWDTKTELEDFGVAVNRYETSLDAILRRVTADQWETMRSGEDGIDAVDYETYHGLFCDYLLTDGLLAGDGGVNRYATGWLEDLDVVHVDRVCYLTAEVTIPAGESLTLSAQMAKPASFNYSCTHTEDRGVNGYDMVTRLGSTLAFTGQTATLEDRGQIAIVRQNFGFDLESGIKTVALDTDEAHYYLEVKRLEQEKAE